MFEFSYTVEQGKHRTIHAKSVREVLRLVPEAENIKKGPAITNAGLVDRQPAGKKVDPGRNSMV